MPLQNRVTPFGEIVASEARGTLMGNRGCLHDAHRALSRRRWTTRAWLSCLLSFGGRRRELMRPGYYTELFFLDEATALAAGPCAECHREAFRRFIFGSANSRRTTTILSAISTRLPSVPIRHRVGQSASGVARFAKQAPPPLSSIHMLG